MVVRWDHIDRGVYEAISSMEEQLQAQGSPFANPADVTSNIEGGLGLVGGLFTFCGYGDLHPLS